MKTKKIAFLFMIALLLLGGGIFAVRKVAAAFPTSRDPIYWPFTAASPWNMPIHNSAQYVPAGIHMPLAWGPTIDEEILILEPTAPLKWVKENTAGWSGASRCGSVNSNNVFPVQVPVPNNFHTDPGYDGNTPNMSAAILMPDGVTLKHTQPLHVCSDGGVVTSQYTWPDNNIKTSDGLYGSHGGTGMSAIGGSLRVNELLPGSVIHHALKMNFYALYNYAYNNDGTRGYRWPATQADSYASSSTYGGDVSAFEVGALLALKPDFNINSLQTVPAKIIAQAAMDYGIYAVDDTAWDVFSLDIEWGPDGRVQDQFQSTYGWSIGSGDLLNCTAGTNSCKYSQDWWTILSNLNVVNNNTSSTIGGGPNGDTTNRRAPMAPPFIGEATATAVGPTNTSVPPTATKTNTPVGPTNTPGANTSYEAEASANTLAGAAAVAACTVCSGGNKVGNVGSVAANTLQFNNINVATAGSKSVTIYYLNGDAGNRTASMSVNGGGATVVTFPPSGTWPNPNLTSITISITLNAGNNTIKFSNASAWAPDFDRIVVAGGTGPTNTPVPPTATRTSTPVPPTATRTNTPVGPTPTKTNTPVGPTPTRTATPTATSSNTYTQDFSGGSAPNWTLTSCSVSNAELVCENWGGLAQGIYTGQTFSGSYVYKVDLYSWATGYNDNLVYFNYTDANNYYAVDIKDNNAALLIKKVGGTQTTIATGPSYSIYNVWTTVEVTYNAGTITVKATKSGTQTTLFNNVSDSSFTSGKIGGSISSNHLELDNVSVH